MRSSQVADGSPPEPLDEGALIVGFGLGALIGRVGKVTGTKVGLATGEEGGSLVLG